MTWRRSAQAGLGALMLSAAVSCAPASSGAEQIAPQEGAVDGGSTPEFSGPWADLFAEAYRNASTDALRTILAGGEVTDAEYAQVHEAFSRCLADVGYEVTFYPGGTSQIVGGSADDPDSVLEDHMRRCNRDHVGDVDLVYEQVARNPENLDEWTIMAACLVREGVVPSSFGRADYEAWFMAEDGRSLPYTVSEREGEQVFGACNTDPLGLFG